jgi:hypothetical protein
MGEIHGVRNICIGQYLALAHIRRANLLKLRDLDFLAEHLHLSMQALQTQLRSRNSERRNGFDGYQQLLTPAY